MRDQEPLKQKSSDQDSMAAAEMSEECAVARSTVLTFSLKPCPLQARLQANVGCYLK